MATTPDDDLTRASIDGDVMTVAATGPARTPTSLPGHRFEPGAMIAGRYRVVALLGRGGMGEVYRADDLTLDLPVALKFLPASAATSHLGQFRTELKLARQVAHKNVCRVYDLGEADGRPFLTMEYIDGEDLSSLLRRIGRIPHDKAVDIARQLCAGIAAAHERSVIHRDLKPSNVMIDGDGNVRVTDFGIATAGAAEADFAGTPQYMAPEQFAGRPASIKSDVYALGLILFETFTGRRAVASNTIEELRQFHKSGTVTTPSSVIQDIDPAVERVLLRCLDRDPERRPMSALVVAAALPGADPLAAALAAGETPSPELLAAAGEADAIPVARGLGLVAAIVAGLVIAAGASARTSFVGQTPLDLPPDVLVDRAQQVIRTVGHSVAAGDAASGFVQDTDYIRWLAEQDRSPGRFKALASGNPSAMRFWYRTSPRPMQPLDAFLGVTPDDPPITQTDMRLVILDPAGRLRAWRSVPPQRDVSATAAVPQWEPLFAAAGLDLARFTSVPPQWTPRDFADTRAAWEGPLGPDGQTTVRVEAAAYAGKATAFQVVGAWTQPTLMTPTSQSAFERAIQVLLLSIFLVLLATATVLARTNLRGNRADRRGAARLVLGVGATGIVSWLLAGHHSGALLDDFDALLKVAADLALLGAILWPLYIALEPYARRYWPDGLLGWSRLLAGHFLDPRFGRDLLLGLAGGVAVAGIELARVTVLPALGNPAPYPTHGGFVLLLGETAPSLAAPLLHGVSEIETTLMCALVVVILRLVSRFAWLNTLLIVTLMTLLSTFSPGSTTVWASIAFAIVAGVALTFVLLRVGLLPFGITLFTRAMLLDTPFTQNLSTWSATPGRVTLAVLVGLTLLGFYAARAGQPLFGSIAKDP